MALKFADDPGVPEDDGLAQMTNSLIIERGETAQSVLDKFLNELRLKRNLNWSEVRPNLKHLIRPGVNVIHLNRIADIFPDDPKIALEVLQMISAQASTLSQLTIFGQFCRRYSNMGIEIKTEICKMATLKKLVIKRFPISIEVLMDICIHLPELEVLDVLMIPSIPIFQSRGQAFGFASCAKNLQILSFTSLNSDHDEGLKYQEKLTRFCVLRMPHLHYVGCPSLPIDMTDSIVKQTQISFLRRIFVLISTPQQQIKTFSRFPYVEFLTIKWEKSIDYPPIQESNFGVFLNLRQFKSLRLLELPQSSYLELMLKNFGSNLKELIVNLDQNKVKNVRFMTIFKLCPNLENLTLHNIQSPAKDSAWIFPFFHSLRNLNLSIMRNTDQDAPVRLSDILAAPNLENVVLDGLTVTFKQLKATAQLIKGGKILNKLVKLYMLVKSNDGNDDDLKQEVRNLKKELQKFRPETTIVAVTLPTAASSKQTEL